MKPEASIQVAEATAEPSASGSTERASSSAVPQELPFRRDAEDLGFPVGGAMLLIGLMIMALWLVWQGKRRGVSSQGGRSWASLFGVMPSPSAQEVRVVASTRLDASTRIHVVEWHGRQLLVAVNGSAPPVVLDRFDAPALREGGES